MEEKVSYEVAESDFRSWLQQNHIPEDKIENLESCGKIVIKSIVSGVLILQEDGQLKQKLNKEIGAGTGAVRELIFNARINRKMVSKFLNGVKPDDSDGRLVAYMAASTGVNKAILTELMPEDQRVADNVTVFFVN